MHLKNIYLIIIGLLLSGCASEQKDWGIAQSNNNREKYLEFIQKYPDGEHINEAKQRLEALEFESAQKSDEISAYEAFLSKYPSGDYVNEAKQRLEALEFKRTQELDEIGAYETFLSKYPSGNYVNEAKQRLEALEFKRTQESDEIGAYEAFLSKYPSGNYVNEAKQRLEALEFKRTLKLDEAVAYEEYLEKYPTGEYATKAKQRLAVLKEEMQQAKALKHLIENRITEFQSGAVKPEFVIPFDAFGERWANWKELDSKKGRVGFFLTKVSWASEPQPGLYGPFNEQSTGITRDSYGFFAIPTGDGSIISFKTDGVEFPYFGPVKFTSEKGKEIYFGVIANIGLVHLYGSGKVSLPTGEVVILE